MRLYPAIDMIDGKSVRLVQGDYNKKTVFNENPLETALNWQNLGGEFIHIVDLDGARSGSMKNFDIICKIANTLNIPIEVGGGIRSMDAVESYLNNGVSRVIIGTSAIKNPAFVKEVVKKYGHRIAVGIDAKNGNVAISGWEETSQVSALSLAKQMEQIGVSTIIYTDISTDGMLKGPNCTAMKEMTEYVSSDIVASGGVTTLEDLKNLSKTGVEGAIIGKALYTGHIKLDEAVKLCENL